MSHVFFSYMTEDMATVEAIRRSLESLGFHIWIDRRDLAGGARWRGTIREAIREATYFVAFFSQRYEARSRTYMNEELTIAIEELRLRSRDTPWFIPVRLADCEIPDLDIGAGETLSDIQRIDLFGRRQQDFRKLAEALYPALAPETRARIVFEAVVTLHVQRKIDMYRKMSAPLFQQTIDRWLGLCARDRLVSLSETFSECHRRSRSTKKGQLDRIVEPAADGRFVLISVVPHDDIGLYLQSLAVPNFDTGHRYIDFVLEQRRLFRQLPTWQKRDFVHILCMEGEDETVFDILYLESLSLWALIVGFLASQMKPPEPGAKAEFLHAAMFPTSLLTAGEAGLLWERVYKEDANHNAQRPGGGAPGGGAF
jgi:hypothetical protein